MLLPETPSASRRVGDALGATFPEQSFKGFAMFDTLNLSAQTSREALGRTAGNTKLI
jgi:hypothetical protein